MADGADGEAAHRPDSGSLSAGAESVPQSPPAQAEGGAPAVPVTAPAAAPPPGLLYYAVYLPAPAPGLPIYIPAGQAAGMPIPGAMPAMLPPGHVPPALPPAPDPAAEAQARARAHNQKLLIWAIIGAVFLVHLPWLIYLFGVHGCWGTFLETCGPASDSDLDALSEPMLFARISYFILRVQTVVMADWAQFSNVLQLSTGIGSFVLTKIVAANGLVAQGLRARIALAATCATAFVVLFWAEMHLTGNTTFPELGEETVLGYIDQMLPAEFPAFSDIRASLMQYLQFLRLADALILGAALAMSSARKP